MPQSPNGEKTQSNTIEMVFRILHGWLQRAAWGVVIIIIITNPHHNPHMLVALGPVRQSKEYKTEGSILDATR